MARTPSTEDVYEGDGTTAVFQFHFPFLHDTDVFVSVDDVNVSFTILPGSTAQVQLTVPPPVGSIVKVYRSTLAFVPEHLFASGVPFLPRYVDENNRQLLYASQEAINDTAVTAAEALVIAEEAKQIAQDAEDKIDGAIIDSAFQLRLDLADTVDPDKGADLVGLRRNLLSGAVSTANAALNGTAVSIWEFEHLVVKGDPSDVATWDWAAACNAAGNSGAGAVIFPPITGGVYRTLSTVDWDYKVAILGYGPKRLGETAGVCIDNQGTGDTLRYSVSRAIYDGRVQGIGLYSTTGHALNVKYGAVRCVFEQYYFYTRASNRSCIAFLYNTGTAGVDFVGSYSNVFRLGECIVNKVAGRTAPIIDILCAGAYFNENDFSSSWVSNAIGRPAIRMMATIPGQLLSGNRFRGVTPEYCEGGFVLLQATDRTVIECSSAWDQPAGYRDTVIKVSNDLTVMANRGLLISGYARKGSDLIDAGFFDIDLGNSIDTHIVLSTTLSAASPSIECRNRSVTMVGSTNAVLTNTGALNRMEGARSIAPEFVTLGGNRLRDLSGAADVQAPAGVVSLSSTVGANTQRLILSGDVAVGGAGGLLPATDNTMQQGAASNRFKTIYLVSNPVVGSDRRYKADIAPIDERVLRAVAAVPVRQYRLVDGDDRVRFGIIAQDLLEAFAAEGLDALDYGVLEHSQWHDATGPVDRYSVCYSELHALQIAVLQQRLSTL